MRSRETVHRDEDDRRAMRAIFSDTDPLVVFWRRTDIVGLERLTLMVDADGVRVHSAIIGVEDGGFQIDHRWHLTPDWRAVSLHVERLGADGRRVVTLERAANAWRVNGEPRPDLDGAEEPDLSVTPFCNTLPIRQLPETPGASRTVDVAYVDGKDLTVTRSRQRYDRVGPQRVRFIDLGVSKGFEADLDLDDQGLVARYEHLFERVPIKA
jgi:uncharacterized protein